MTRVSVAMDGDSQAAMEGEQRPREWKLRDPVIFSSRKINLSPFFLDQLRPPGSSPACWKRGLSI